MPKIRVSRDERWPDYGISNNAWEPELEVTDEELVFIKKAEEDYSKAQKILARVKERRFNATQP